MKANEKNKILEKVSNKKDHLSPQINNKREYVDHFSPTVDGKSQKVNQFSSTNSKNVDQFSTTFEGEIPNVDLSQSPLNSEGEKQDSKIPSQSLHNKELDSDLLEGTFREQPQSLVDRSQNDRIYLTPPEEIKTFDLSIIPVSSQKKPFSEWKQYQNELAPYQGWREHFCNGGYVGIICGRISGNLECIDIDTKNDPRKTIFDEYIEIIPPELLRKLIIRTTPSGGYHLLYRCPLGVIDSNQKLAHSQVGEVILETRGERGYFATHLNQYRTIRGDFDLALFNIDIPEITPVEREILLELARSLDRKPPSGKTFTYGEPAIEKFNQEFDIIDLFLAHGWTTHNEDPEKVTLTRPDSNAPYSGYYFRKGRVFICFSTSTNFKVQKPYNNFQILKVLEGGDDYHRTLRLLPGYGYELSKTREKITPDDIAEYLNKRGVRYDQFRQDLIYKGRIIDEVTYNTLYLQLCRDLEREIPRVKFESVIKSLFIDQYNPIKDFISRYSDRNPKGTFGRWLDCLELNNQDLDPDVVLHFFRKWYVGMVGQSLDGLFPNEFFLALLSQEQGIGKTTLLRRYLLPEELKDYQAEHALSFTDDFKVLMGQVLLLIDDELDGRSFEQSQSFKNLLSIGENTTRRKYDRRISKIRRRASFAGSGNSLKVVKELGERRIIPLEVVRIDHKKLDQLDLVDMFIEAYNLFSEGFEYSFQSGDKVLLDQLYGNHIQESDLDLIIQDVMDPPEEDGDIFYITNLDIVNTLSTLFPNSTRRINTPNVGKKMAEQGFQSKRVGRKKITTYLIGGNSRIIEMLDSECQSWRLMISNLNQGQDDKKSIDAK